MNKKDLVNGCIDLSYNVSKEELRKVLSEKLGRKYMQVKDSKKRLGNIIQRNE